MKEGEFMKKILSIILSMFLLLPNSCLVLANEDIEKAKQYLTTSSAPSKEYLEKHLTTIENYYDIDFSDGIIINERVYRSRTNMNAAYEFDFNLLVGEKNIDMFL